jgi:AcrR family transcriptional regulator
VLAAATAMIARSGDAASLTLRAVAREVGVAATSIYLHFESVEALLAEVKARRFEELARYLTAATEAAGADPVARLRARAHAYVRYGAERPGEYVVMFAARLVSEGGVATRVTAAAALFDVLVEDLLSVRRRGRASMDRAEASMVAFHLWTALHGTVSLRLVRPLMQWPEIGAEVDDLVDRLLALPRARSLQAPAGHGAP